MIQHLFSSRAIKQKVRELTLPSITANGKWENRCCGHNQKSDRINERKIVPPITNNVTVMTRAAEREINPLREKFIKPDLTMRLKSVRNMIDFVSE